MDRLIISDIHLGRKFDKNKYEYLRGLFNSYEEIILNGDFWDHYSTDFNSFVKSKWNKLFPIMKNKTVYIYGNHDKKKWSDKRVNLFSKEQYYIYEPIINDIKYIIRHGHNVDKFRQFERYSFILFMRTTRLVDLSLWIDNLISMFKINRYSKIKEFAKDLNEGEFLITGHKHIPIIDLENNYAVSGDVLFGRSKYLVLKNSGELILKEDSY